MPDPYMARYLEWRLTHPPMMGGSDEAESEEATAETTEPVEAAAEATTPPPWGDDFNPERAWNTIQKQRDREKELEAEAKELHRLRNDPEAQKEFLESLGFEVPEDDDEPEETVEDDPINPRLSALEQKIQEREAAEAAKAFEDHLDELAKGKELELTPRQRKQILRDSIDAGFSPEATEKAFNELVDELTDYERRAIERYTGSKKTPTVPPSSKSATQTPDLDDPKARQAWLKERAEALSRPT